MLPALLALDFQALQSYSSAMVAPANCSGRLRFPAVPIQASGFSCWAMPQTRGACAELPSSSISSLWAARKRNALFSNPRAGRGWRRTNHGFLRWARMQQTQGYAWTSQAGAVLSNPFASELARDSETPSLISPCGPTSGCSIAHLPRCLVVYILVIRG